VPSFESKRTRREILAGAAATVAAAALPALPVAVATATTKPDWLLAAEADLGVLNWFPMFGPGTALTVMKNAWECGEDGVDPTRYDEGVRCQFAKALEYGDAMMAANGRLHITEHGRETWEAEWLDSWS